MYSVERYGNGMSESVAPSRTCRFPGCERPAAPAEEGAGRPPEYCEDPTHNRGAAWRARRATAAVTAGRAVPDDLDRPVSMARARAGEYAERVAAQVETLTVTLGTVVAELRTLGDPDAAAVQIDAVTAEAEQRVAEAMARAARAEQDRRAAEQQRADADAAAEDATAAVDALTGRLEAATAARAAAAAELDQVRRTHAAEVQRLADAAARAAADATEQRARADAAQEQASDARAAHTEMIAGLAAARQRVEDERAHTEARLADQRAGYEDRLTELRAEVDKVRGQNTRRSGARGAAAD